MCCASGGRYGGSEAKSRLVGPPHVGAPCRHRRVADHRRGRSSAGGTHAAVDADTARPWAHPRRRHHLHRRRGSSRPHHATTRAQSGSGSDVAVPVHPGPRRAPRRCRRHDHQRDVRRRGDPAVPPARVAGLPPAAGARRAARGLGAPQGLPPGCLSAARGAVAAPATPQSQVGRVVPRRDDERRILRGRGGRGLPRVHQLPARTPPAGGVRARRRCGPARRPRRPRERGCQPAGVPARGAAAARAGRGPLGTGVRGIPGEPARPRSRCFSSRTSNERRRAQAGRVPSAVASARRAAGTGR